MTGARNNGLEVENCIECRIRHVLNVYNPGLQCLFCSEECVLIWNTRHMLSGDQHAPFWDPGAWGKTK